MIETAAEFSKNEVLPLLERLDQQEEGLMPGLIHKAGELGLCVGSILPRSTAGWGLGRTWRRTDSGVHEPGTARLRSLTGSRVGSARLGLNLFGTEAQKQKRIFRSSPAARGSAPTR